MSETTVLPRGLMLMIAAIQGLALFALLDAKVWPTDQPFWSFPLWTVAVFAPLVMLLSLTPNNTRQVFRLTGVLTALLVMAAMYVGWQVQPYEETGTSSIAVIFVVSSALAVFKALMHLQQRANQVPLTYDLLFTYSWRNFLVAALSGAFVGGVAVILALWGGLFSIIGIDFFADLFTEPWFFLPVASIAFGLGVTIFRNLTHIIDSINRLLEALIRLLLPLVVVVALIFIGTLPIVGLGPLWDTGTGTALLLWLTTGVLFFVNAVYQSGRETIPYPLAVHRLVYVGVCVLPIVSALSFYGLWLRVEQYSWTVERCWAMVVWLVLALFSFGYTFGVVRRGVEWPETLGRVNTYMGLGILALMLLVNLPVLDFRKIALSSQEARVESGVISWQEFDFFYATNNLGRPGYLLKQRLLEEIGDTDPELKDLIENPRHISTIWMQSERDQIWQSMSFRPPGIVLPDGLQLRVTESVNPSDGGEYVMIEIDLTGDDVDDYVVLVVQQGYVGYGYLFYVDGPGNWQMRNMYRRNQQQQTTDGNVVQEGAITTSAPRFSGLKIEELLFEVQ